MSQKPERFSSAAPTTKKPNWTGNNFAVQFVPKSASTAIAISPEVAIAKLASWGPPAISDARQINSGRCARSSANAGMENGLSARSFEKSLKRILFVLVTHRRASVCGTTRRLSCRRRHPKRQENQTLRRRRQPNTVRTLITRASTERSSITTSRWA